MRTLLLLLGVLGCDPADQPDKADPPDDSADSVAPCAPQTWHPDADGDGYGDGEISVEACEAPVGYVADNDDGDCDDTDASVRPGVAEVCDDVDQDCDGEVDEGAGDLWYQDSDGDSFGAAARPTTACEQPTGYVADATDCDDDRAEVYPGGAEACDDGRDGDCDGLADCEDDACAMDPTCYELDCADSLDGDDDGYADCADEDCWSPACGTVIRATVRGGSIDHTSTDFDTTIDYDECSEHTLRVESAFAELASVTGTVRVRAPSDCAWRTCEWRVDAANLLRTERFASVTRTKPYYIGSSDYGGSVEIAFCGDTTSVDIWYDLSTEVLDRSGAFYLTPGCDLDSAFLPATLTPLGEGDWAARDGHVWYDASGDVLKTGEAHVVFED